MKKTYESPLAEKIPAIETHMRHCLEVNGKIDL